MTVIFGASRSTVDDLSGGSFYNSPNKTNDLPEPSRDNIASPDSGMSTGEILIMLSNHTMRIDGKKDEHMMVVDTYYRKIHVPYEYFYQY